MWHTAVEGQMWLRLEFRAHRKCDMFVKHTQIRGGRVEARALQVFYRHVRVAYSLYSSHSSIECENVLVARVSGTSEMCDTFIKHKQNYEWCLEMRVLVSFYTHVRFSMCARLKLQQHFQVRRHCGYSLMGVGFRDVAVAHKL